MQESSIQSRRLEWKWVGIVFSLLLLFYLLPISLAGKAFVHHPNYVVGRIYESPTVHAPQAFFIGGWAVVGVIILTGFPAFYARKSVLRESGIGALLLTVVWFVVYYAYMVPQGLGLIWSDSANHLTPSLAVMAIVVFFLSLVGAWLGERWRKTLKTEPS